MTAFFAVNGSTGEVIPWEASTQSGRTLRLERHPIKAVYALVAGVGGFTGEGADHLNLLIRLKSLTWPKRAWLSGPGPCWACAEGLDNSNQGEGIDVRDEAVTGRFFLRSTHHFTFRLQPGDEITGEFYKESYAPFEDPCPSSGPSP